MYKLHNKPQDQMTASPDKYPQKTFKSKQCRKCGTSFDPKAPSHLYCSQECADWGLSSRYLRRNYGIDADDYADMLAAQDSKCKICQSLGLKINKNAKVHLVVDHDHQTGAVRGLLCHNCNRALGLLQDNKEIAYRAAEYLGNFADS